MVKIYIRKILAGTMLWTDVPSLWQNKVVTELEKQGYTCNEDGTVAKAEPEATEETEETPAE